MMRSGSSIGRGEVEHWHTDDQFARQLGSPGQAATILRRWAMFASGLERIAHTSGEPLRVLDAGCGDGINLVGLRRIFDATHQPVHLVAVDVSPLRVERARVPGRAAGAIACARVEALPFDCSTFDVVLCNHVVEHLTDPAAALREISRVLRPSGVAIVGVPNEGSHLGRLRNHLLQPSILKTTDHVNFFTAPALRTALGKAGLVVTEVRPSGFFVPHLRVFGWLAQSAAGRSLLDWAGRMWPSQAADLIAFARREA